MQLTALSTPSASPQRRQAADRPADEPALPRESFTLESPAEEPPIYRFTSRNFTADGSPVTLELRLPDIILNPFSDDQAFQPIVNPDGYKPSEGWWSRNRRPETGTRDPAVGVDLNRHYRDDFPWQFSGEKP
jgi:hypothetical protein